jgi:hypothetical protein
MQRWRCNCEFLSRKIDIQKSKARLPDEAAHLLFNIVEAAAATARSAAGVEVWVDEPASTTATATAATAVAGVRVAGLRSGLVVVLKGFPKNRNGEKMEYDSSLGQGCQIFLDTIYQNEGKYTKLP